MKNQIEIDSEFKIALKAFFDNEQNTIIGIKQEISAMQITDLSQIFNSTIFHKLYSKKANFKKLWYDKVSANLKEVLDLLFDK